MDLKLEPQGDTLLATIGGRLSLPGALKLAQKVCDAAAEGGFSKILADCSALEGKLSVIDRYELGKTMAEYCLTRSMTLRAAIFGSEPAITGFGAQVARNRGLTAMTFAERQAALDWLDRLRPVSRREEPVGGASFARLRH